MARSPYPPPVTPPATSTSGSTSTTTSAAGGDAMTPDARAARERKQKIFVLVGGLALLALLAFQLPKLLGGSSSPEAAATTSTLSTTPVVGQPVVGTTPSPVPVSGAPAATEGKITSFGVFVTKDPFVQQQAVTPVPGTEVGGGAQGDGAGKVGAGGKQAKPRPASPPHRQLRPRPWYP